jgi:branched-chain amino acid transport system substrate-binding protein
MFQAGVYSALMHYLKAIDATGTDDAKTVVARMKAMPVNDFFAKNGRIREDGRMVHDMYLMQLKTPAESKDPGMCTNCSPLFRATKPFGRCKRVAVR